MNISILKIFLKKRPFWCHHIKNFNDTTIFIFMIWARYQFQAIFLKNRDHEMTVFVIKAAFMVIKQSLRTGSVFMFETLEVF